MFTVIRASLLVGPTRHDDHYYCECAQYNVITGRCVALPVVHRVTNDESSKSRAHAHLGRLFRTAKNRYEGDWEEGPYVRPTWAVITASAVGHTVTLR